MGRLEKFWVSTTRLMTTLRSQPLRGEVDAHFFVSLATYKLDVAKLESNARTLVAYYRTPLRKNEPPALTAKLGSTTVQLSRPKCHFFSAARDAARMASTSGVRAPDRA